MSVASLAARRKAADRRTPKPQKAAAPRRSSAGGDAAAGRRVLLMEAEGLSALAASLDGGFGKAVDILAAVGAKGGHARVIVSGMGKSGLVARKIAATMASTGTPAFFVHPAEASHGDLGMVTQGDALMCLSNSGDVPEMADLIAHAKRFALPLIGITSRAGSALGQAADVVLLLPNIGEACPMGLAPTTSTTMMLALGDALAVALLERKGFSRDDYRVFHPGGRLGKQLIRVRDLMHTGSAMPLVPSGTGMRDALLAMAGRPFGCIGILGVKGKERDRLVGIVTDGDLRRHIHDDLLDRTVDAVMTRNPATILPTALAVEALRDMNLQRRLAYFVVEDGKPVGILHMHDCVRAGIT